MTTPQNPWGEHSFYKTEAAWNNFCKGLIRRGSSRYPEKIAFMKENRFRLGVGRYKNGKKKTLWGATCNDCKEDFPLGKMEVDHIHLVGRFDMNLTIGDYFGRMFPHRSGYQWLCSEKGNGCHDNKTVRDIAFMKTGLVITPEDAVRAQQATAIGKYKVDKLKAHLVKRGAKEEHLKNKATRDAFIKESYNLYWK